MPPKGASSLASVCPVNSFVDTSTIHLQTGSKEGLAFMTEVAEGLNPTREPATAEGQNARSATPAFARVTGRERSERFARASNASAPLGTPARKTIGVTGVEPTHLARLVGAVCKEARWNAS